MRVLEADPSISYNMGKNKKHRIRKSKENEVEESSEDGSGCPHVTKAVNLAALRKAVQKTTVTLGECSGCIKDGPKSSSRDLFGGLIEGVAAAEGDDADPAETTVCICLQCGYQGCDRNSHSKHALKHFKTPHSGIHSVIVNLTTWTTWCYMCDEEVTQNPRITGCIDFLQKQVGISKPEPIQIPGRSAESPVAEAALPFTNTSAGKNSPISCMKVKGLSNLGNTCFFNAVMQSLCQTRGLETVLLDRCRPSRVTSIPGLEPNRDSDSGSSSEDEKEESARLNLKLPSIQTVYGDPGPITLALLSFVQEMRGGTTKNGTVNPIALFTQVCKKAPRFKGFQQQDSHELLRYLIDCIRTEEIKRGQASILKFFKLPESISPKKVDEETKYKVKEYGRQVKHTFLDGLFGGHLVSTVKCEECKTVSQIFEAFLDLSLPVMEEKPLRPNLILIGKKKDSLSLGDSIEDGEVLVSAASSMGLDGLSEKPSKYQERKNKRMAKKDAKKQAKLHTSKSRDLQMSAGGVEKKEEDDSGECDQDGGSEDSNKNDNENEINRAEKEDKDEEDNRLSNQGSGLGSAATGCSLTDESYAVLNVNQNGCMADSSPEGSKHDGLERNGVEDRDDPSDADIEDNLENDMCKLEIHGTAGTNSHSNADSLEIQSGNSLEVPDQHTDDSRLKGDLIFSITASVSSIEYSLTGLDSHSVINHPISTEYSTSNVSLKSPEEAGESSNKQAQADVTSEILPGNFPVRESDNDATSSLCSGVQRLQVSKTEIQDEISISCEISVDKSDAVSGLSNDLNKLTVCDSNTATQIIDTKNSSTVSSVSGEANFNSGIIEDLKSCLDVPEVSATFNIILHNTSAASPVVDHSGKVPVCRQSSQADTKHTQNCRDTAEVQVASVEEKSQEHHNLAKTRQEYLKEARSYSMSTMSPRYHPSSKECSILSCLNQFTAAELLTGSNKFGCKECTMRRRKNSHPTKDKKTKDTVYSNANKQYLVFRPPAVLTLHLKRFEQTGLTSRKVNRHVEFPLLLDLAPYCSVLCQGVKEGQTKVLYSLYGVVEHSGRLTGGHYTAYIKVRPGMSPHTQFIYSQAPGPNDLLNMYLTRVLKSKEACVAGHDLQTDRQEAGDAVDRETEARAEALLPPGRWYHISDSRVNEVAEAEVLRAQAYLLFYERIF